MIRSDKRTSWTIAFGAFSALLLLEPPSPSAATMNDYCIQPAFIRSAVPPNLLFLIDNSASMYDLSYADEGKKNADATFARQPYYCYDQTYSNAKAGGYDGYFDQAKKYQYNFDTERFAEVASIPANCSMAASATVVCKVVSDTLHVNIDTVNTAQVKYFYASGKYLNWLSASKFDIEKKVLTGGKYVDKVCSGSTDTACISNGDCPSGQTCTDVANFIQAESRGCVGQSFIKEANTANFVNYNSPETNNTNTSLGITFGVRGPYDDLNRSAPSPGGQTYIDIFNGNYNQGDCQGAVAAITSGGNADIKQAVDACLAYSSGGTQTAVTKTKVSFQQSMQACWQYREGRDIGGDDINTVKNQCTDIFDEFGTCSNNPQTVCTTDAGCGAGNTCIFGPSAIVPGNPGLLCSSEYEGQYYQLSAATGVCKKKNSPDMGACASDADCTGPGYKCSGASGAAWVLKAGVTEAAMIETHRQFCRDMTAPPVIDPTDAPSDTAQYDNVPAILSGVGLEAQLNQPIATMKVRLSSAAAPTGLVQQYADRIRMGVMTFNFSGSASEVPPVFGAPLSKPRTCSNDSSKVCTTNIDCGAGTCQDTVAGTSNLDGGAIKYLIGKGICSATTTTECATDANCPSGERCISSGVGDHVTTSSLVNEIDKIRAATWTPFAEAFYNAIGYFGKAADDNASGIKSRTDLRLNSNDFSGIMNPSQYRCQANNVLIVSDGMSTADQNSSVNSLAQLYTAAGGETGACSSYAGSKNLDNLAWIAQHRNINSFSKTEASTTAPVYNSEKIKSYVVFTGTSNGAAGECNSRTLMSQTAQKGGTTLYEAERPEELKTKLNEALNDIAGGTASGTAASILSNSEGSGANILQAVFYPRKDFSSTEGNHATWLGEMQNLWYYIDPFITNSSVREDTGYSSGDHVLHLQNDNIVKFSFNATEGKTEVELWQDSDGDGDADVKVSTIDPDALKSLWRAGNQLWARSSARDITTTCLTADSGVCTNGFMPFTSGNATRLRAYLDVADDASATKIINYVHGTDSAEHRNRTVTTSNFVSGATETHVWKLGDIVSSTPRILSSARLNTYNLPAPGGYNDKSYASFLTSNEYKNRGLAFVGANDGMLHAFKLGTMSVAAAGKEKARLTGTGLGEELGAFIPTSALPYLKYLADKDYAHLFYVDGPTVLFDASIGTLTACTDNYAECVKNSTVINSSNGNLDATKNTWRTILIGSMGLGGASGDVDFAAETPPAAEDCTNCVKTPISKPVDASRRFGYSSYFALDFTDSSAPKFLWEFSDPELGYATSGPAIVRVGDVGKNGKWFAVFATGPTGPIDTGTHQFLGRSDRTLKLFVVDLATGTVTKLSSNIANAFAGSLVGATIDTDRWNPSAGGYYEDDALYFGYTAKDTSSAAEDAWTKGGVLRLSTGEDLNPANWKITPVIDGIGPVTTAVGRLVDRKSKNLWLYFGTGRYFFKKRTNGLTDDFSSGQAIYGIKEPCYTSANLLDKTCMASNDASVNKVAVAELTNQSSDTPSATLADGKTKGWFINLGAADNAGGYGAERVVTDPTTLTNGIVLFTSFMPTVDPCGFGGRSYLWATKFDTGAEPSAKAKEGKILLQLSTGSFEEKNIATTFTQRGNRRSGSHMEGKPPGDQSLVITKSQNKPLKKVLHIMER